MKVRLKADHTLADAEKADVTDGQTDGQMDGQM